MGRTSQRALLLGESLALALALACTGLPVARMEWAAQTVSPASQERSSVWGTVGSGEFCLDLKPPVAVVLYGSGLPDPGLRCPLQGPLSKGGRFGFYGLAPGVYRIALALPPDSSRPLYESESCDLAILVEPREVTLELKEGESAQVSLVLLYSKNAPEGALVSPLSIPMVDARSTTTGATIGGEVLQNVPLHSPPDR